jgi:hypothetical protein
MQSKRKKISRVIIGICIVVTMAVALGMSGGRTSAQSGPSEQVIFSGVGFADTGDWTGPVGYWIWCQPTGTGPYVEECAGAMYVYSQELTKGVNGTITEGSQEDSYTIDVVANDGSNFSAELTNQVPVKRGPKNTVDFTVTTPSGTSMGSSSNSVVIVTQ